MAIFFYSDEIDFCSSLETGNSVVPDLGAEVMRDVTFSSGPVKLEDLQ